MVALARPSTRWYPLTPHEAQYRYWRSVARFNATYAGRRSGKTEVAKRRVVKRAFEFPTLYPHVHDGYFIFGAPTMAQARDIFWKDLKAMIPPHFRLKKPSESMLSITLITGVELRCIGLDVPERAEGRPIDGGVLDEYGNMKESVWTQHLRPALDTVGRPGWMDFIGVPEGRNHYYDLVKAAEADTTGEWATHHWLSSEILPPNIIEQARRDLDPLVFAQEYEGSFVSFLGRAYYNFDVAINGVKGLPYDPEAPLIFCFDFNVAPGVAVVCQEIQNDGRFPADKTFTGIIGEVYIPQNSNTEMVTRKLAEDWKDHKGPIRIYGDATGGAQKSSSGGQSDWDLVERGLYHAFGPRQVRSMYARANPSERARVNAMNTRFRNADAEKPIVRLLVDITKAPRLVKDLEGVQTVEGGSGEIDKKTNKELTHISDALGYYVAEEFPVVTGRRSATQQMA